MTSGTGPTGTQTQPNYSGTMATSWTGDKGTQTEETPPIESRTQPYEPSTTDTLPVLELLEPADESQHHYGETEIAFNYGDGSLPDGFEMPDYFDYENYDYLVVNYYIRCGDAALTGASCSDGSMDLKLAVLSEDASFCLYRAVVFIPKGMDVNADEVTISTQYAWNRNLFDSYLPDEAGWIPVE